MKFSHDIAFVGSLYTEKNPYARFSDPGTYLHGPLLPKNPHVCDYLLREAKVVMVPGIAYNEAECCVRASLATGTADLKRAAAAVKKALNGAC